ncbi:MAG TPA: imidazole glycerol phosphate synthase subunit HisH, partial [Bacillota bacterium]|nr:imidazole glycerol phosphate synthase subunit HisH [Bacillota bacterium]
MIAVIDYGIGNLFSITRSLDHLGYDTVITGEPEVLKSANGIILPGVGAFGDAMDKLKATGLVPLLTELKEKKPFLGICLGMQLLCEYSEENDT